MAIGFTIIGVIVFILAFGAISFVVAAQTATNSSEI